ncbi:zinc ribbon domain-containing protein [Delftia tsuruhatensis]|uniref:Zinc ribbon domain-containing protein n=1 Tax=Delftia tsuruhatensis TaxID=180282 RepID=A0AAX3SPN0_9BURK|nr:zinc ribbon domain-containing protein [Delftia tsuruhatensis]WFF81948.1 zinc ribbon domain-containing protein [Delftia tsuruhatensis]
MSAPSSSSSSTSTSPASGSWEAAAAAPAMVRKHPCPECGANLEWNAQAQALKCPYCGTTVPWSEETREELGRDVVEQDLAEALRNPKSGRGWGTEDRYEVQCQNCRAISVFVNRTVAQRCDFCGSPSIVAHEGQGDAITPQSILPFKISDGQIRDRIRQWYGSRWFAPNRLKSAALTDTLHGVYLPYWTFDAHASADWQAEAGFYYYTTESYRDSNGNVQTRQVRHVRWEPASGSLAHFFDDELVPGTVGVHANLLRQVEPFPTTTDLKPYTPEFVRGWTVERYQIDLGKAAQVNVQDMDEQLRALCARQVPGDTYRNLQMQREYQGRTFKHILVPVWLVGYTYGSRTFQIIANGYTGQIAGERPYSALKITLTVLAMIMVLALLWVMFGQ